jgi:dienelactone hydrolase
MRRLCAFAVLLTIALSAQELPAPDADLRTMLRRHVARRAAELLEREAGRRQAALRGAGFAEYRAGVRASLAGMLGPMPFGASGGALNVRVVSRHDRGDYRIENVLYESLPGWDVNATLFLPNPAKFAPPWPAIVLPVGHSGKQFESYQIPAQVFARSGYLALLFDPPGQAGEKRAGNDHFRDGVRCYLTGSTSQRFFVLDALRSIDYLATRQDVDMRSGVGITGVSGGGFTALYATLLDDRIRASGPSCFGAPELEHPVKDLYPPCPETLPFGLYPRGLDAVSLLVAACPTPLLMMAGAEDEVFKAGWMKRMAAEVEHAYGTTQSTERFRFFLDAGGHAYSVAQAVEFVHWMDRWVRATPGRVLPPFDASKLEMAPETLLRSNPRPEQNMLTVVAAEAARLAASRKVTDIRRAAMEVARVTSPPQVLGAKRSQPFLIWADFAEEVLLKVDTDVELPATFLYPAKRETTAGGLLYFDDRGRWTDLASGGTLSRMSGFLAREGVHPAVLSVDLRGWGDTRPAFAPYEAAGWAAPERWLAYVSAAVGDPVLAMRIRDGLASLAWLRAQPGVDPERVVVGGRGMGGIVALHVAAIDGRLRGVFASHFPASFRMLAESPLNSWPHDAFLPGVLAHYDVPELIANLKMPVLTAPEPDALCAWVAARWR